MRETVGGVSKLVARRASSSPIGGLQKVREGGGIVFVCVGKNVLLASRPICDIPAREGERGEALIFPSFRLKFSLFELRDGLEHVGSTTRRDLM